MKQYFLCFYFAISFFQAEYLKAQISQSIKIDSIRLNMTELYALKIYVKDSITTSFDYCANKNKRKLIYTLYQIEVDTIYALRDSTVYIDYNDLKNLSYCLASPKQHLNIGKSFYVTMYNAGHKEYTFINRINLNETKFIFEQKPRYLILGPLCNRLSLFARIGLFLGFNEDKILKKAKPKKKENNPFIQAINKKIFSTNIRR